MENPNTNTGPLARASEAVRGGFNYATGATAALAITAAALTSPTATFADTENAGKIVPPAVAEESIAQGELSVGSITFTSADLVRQDDGTMAFNPAKNPIGARADLLSQGYIVIENFENTGLQNRTDDIGKLLNSANQFQRELLKTQLVTISQETDAPIALINIAFDPGNPDDAPYLKHYKNYIENSRFKDNENPPLPYGEVAMMLNTQISDGTTEQTPWTVESFSVAETDGDSNVSPQSIQAIGARLVDGLIETINTRGNRELASLATHDAPRFTGLGQD